MYISYKKHGIRIGQVWFEEAFEPKKEKLPQLLLIHGCKEEKQGSNVKNEIFHSLVSDLTVEEDLLYSGIQKNVRYEIRKNQKETVTVHVFDAEELQKNPQELHNLEEMYQAMYRSKGMKHSLNHEQMLQYARTGGLLLTEIRQEQTPLVIHSYLTDGKQVRLLHSVSEFREEGMDANLVARANKRLHWEDLKKFREMGMESYDWGGISNPENPNGIDSFKMKFGGTPVTYYNVLEATGFLGKLALRLLNK